MGTAAEWRGMIPILAVNFRKRISSSREPHTGMTRGFTRKISTKIGMTGLLLAIGLGLAETVKRCPRPKRLVICDGKKKPGNPS